MYSEIVESDHLKHLSIKHLCLVTDDIVDYTSEEVKKWAPSFENYYLEKINDDNTRFTVITIEALVEAPLNQPIPYGMITDIVKYRVKENNHMAEKNKK